MSSYNANKAKKNVTIEDIAKKLGVSKSTVSKALSSATDVNEQTRERILSCASELGYVAKKPLIRRKKNMMVFVYNIDQNSVDQFAYELLLGFQAAANESQYGVNVMSVNTAEMLNGSYTQAFVASDYDGCFFIGFKPHQSFLQSLSERNLPMVVLDDFIDAPQVVKIGCDNDLGITMMVKHLAEYRHKHIAFLGGEQDSMITKDRERAYLQALEGEQLTADRKLIGYGSYQKDFDHAIVTDFLNNGATAIVCASDRIALESIRIIQNMGLSVPEDVSITGFDDLPIARYSNPSLTTISQNRVQLGKCAFMTICHELGGMRATQVTLRPELVIRNSTYECKNKNSEINCSADDSRTAVCVL